MKGQTNLDFGSSPSLCMNGGLTEVLHVASKASFSITLALIHWPSSVLQPQLKPDMHPIRIYSSSSPNSPVLDLGQNDLSREELERLEEEERRIDDAIRESENRTWMRTETGIIGKVL